MGRPVPWSGPQYPSLFPYQPVVPSSLIPVLPVFPAPLTGPWSPLAKLGLSNPFLPSAGIYKGFCLDVIRNKYECELQGAKQHLEVTDGCPGRRM